MVAERLLAFDVVCYTCHCTGKEAYMIMRRYMGDKLCYFSAGEILEV